MLAFPAEVEQFSAFNTWTVNNCLFVFYLVPHLAHSCGLCWRNQCFKWSSGGGQYCLVFLSARRVWSALQRETYICKITLFQAWVVTVWTMSPGLILSEYGSNMVSLHRNIRKIMCSSVDTNLNRETWKDLNPVLLFGAMVWCSAIQHWWWSYRM